MFRGWLGEKKTTFHMWLSLDSHNYKRFHNLILPSRNGTTQIDHLIVSQYGVFIVETKNRKGWIYGSAKQPRWTQTMYRNKYSFQNPLRQTYRQKKVLAEFLSLDEQLIHPIVYFVGDCSLKTSLPSNVMNSGLGRYIRQFKNPVLSPSDTHRIIGELQSYLSQSTLTYRDHRRSLRKRHESTTVCPKCGGDLVERIARKGPNAGKKFLGCAKFPYCRFTKNPKKQSWFGILARN